LLLTLGHAPVKPQRLPRNRLGVAVGMAAIVLAWLLPNHSPPWGSFYNEAWMAVALMPLAAWLSQRSTMSLRLPVASALIAGLALVPLLQWSAGQLQFFGDALLATSYLGGLAMCLLFGARWRDIDLTEAAGLVFTTLALAALLSTHFALLQWLRSDLLGALLADLPFGGRPNANIAQANHLATLLFLGLVGVWGLYLRNDLRGSVACLAAAWLLLGMAMTQSRTGWLEVALLGIAAVVWHRRLDSRRCLPALLSLLLGFAVLVWLWPTINQALLLDGGLSLADQASAGRRPVLWRTFAQAVAAAPWRGYGWTQVQLAQQAMVPMLADSPGLQIVYTYAHNLELDLLLWNGVPLGLLIVASLGVWFWRQARNVDSADEQLLLLALLGLLLHAQFEFPHAYAYFLLPAGVIAGLLPGDRLRWRLSRPALWALVAAAAALLAVLVGDYIAAESSWQRLRLQAARVRVAPEPDAARLRGLDQLQSLFDQMGQDPKAEMTPAQQAEFKRAVERFPGSGSLYRLASMAAHHGRPDEAASALSLLCSMHKPEVCRRALTAWQAEAEGDAQMAAVPLPTTASMAATASTLAPASAPPRR
jgi:O-antigen ligase